MTTTKTVTSTADLTPAGILGYAKSIAVFVGGLLGILAQFITDDPVRTYVSIGIAVCTFVGAYGFKNQVVPVEVVAPPAPTPPAA